MEGKNNNLLTNEDNSKNINHQSGISESGKA